MVSRWFRSGLTISVSVNVKQRQLPRYSLHVTSVTSPILKMTSTYNWRHLGTVSEAAEFGKTWDFLSKWEHYVDLTLLSWVTYSGLKLVVGTWYKTLIRLCVLIWYFVPCMSKMGFVMTRLIHCPSISMKKKNTHTIKQWTGSWEKGFYHHTCGYPTGCPSGCTTECPTGCPSGCPTGCPFGCPTDACIGVLEGSRTERR